MQFASVCFERCKFSTLKLSNGGTSRARENRAMTAVVCYRFEMEFILHKLCAYYSIFVEMPSENFYIYSQCRFYSNKAIFILIF